MSCNVVMVKESDLGINYTILIKESDADDARIMINSKMKRMEDEVRTKRKLTRFALRS